MVDEYQEKEKLQKELREREKSGFIKFGEEKDNIVYFGDNPNGDEIKKISIPETKYESIYASKSLLGQEMNYSSFAGGEEILADENVITETKTIKRMFEIGSDKEVKLEVIESEKKKYRGEF